MAEAHTENGSSSNQKKASSDASQKIRFGLILTSIWSIIWILVAFLVENIDLMISLGLVAAGLLVFLVFAWIQYQKSKGNRVVKGINTGKKVRKPSGRRRR